MEELWKPIKGFENYYEISNFGRVKRKHRIIERENWHKQTFQEKYMAQYDKGNGRICVTLTVGKKSYKKHVHRLIAEAFIPNPMNKKQINHIDGNPSNNDINNLEWVTQEENIAHAHRNGLINRYVLTIQQEKEVKKDWATGKYTKSDLSRKYDVSRYTIRRIINDDRKIKREQV